MGVVIYGSRPYGRVDAHGGEYAQTSFFHIDFVPLIPRASFWVTHEVGDQRIGFPIKLHLRSVIATYLRVWGAVGAIFAFASVPGVGGLVLAAALAAVSAWSWTWRSLRGKRAQLRSDFNAVALGVRCEPEHLTDELRATIHTALRTRWNAHNTGRSPNEVARYGSADVQETMLAYGLLRLAAVERGRAGVEERSAAERLIDGAHEPLPVEAGPYRGGATSGAASSPPTAAAAISRLAAQITAARPVRPAARKKLWRHHPGVQLVGLAVMTFMSIGGAALAWDAIGPARTVTARELASSRLRGGWVAVDVDAMPDPRWQIDDVFDHGEKRVVLGRMGERALLIEIGAHDKLPGLHVVGRLRHVTHSVRREPWLRAVASDPELDAATFELYLDVTASGEARIEAATGLTIVAGTLALWILWLRAWGARRRARRAA